MKKLNLYLIALLSIFIACSSPKTKQNNAKPKQYKWTNEILGIPYKISYTGKEDYQSKIDSLANHLIHLFSEKNPSSIISSVNKQKTTEIEDKDALYVLQSALSICQETHHAFDPTVKPLYDLFNEYSYNDLLEKTLDTNYYQTILGCEKVAVSNINNSKIIVEKSSNDVKLTLGGIYKGYVVDKIAQFLTAKKVNNFYVELGKTPHVKCSGEMNHSWNAVIKEPKTDSSVIYHTEKMVIDLKTKDWLARM